MSSASPDRLHVLFAMTTDYIPESTGGVESTTHELCKVFGRSGWTPAVLAGCKRNGSFAKRAMWNRLTGRGRLAVDHDLGYPTYRSRRPLKAMDEICRKFSPDVAIVELGRIVPLARALVDRGVPSVIVLYNIVLEQIGGEFFKHPLLRYVTVSQFMATLIKSRFGLEATVIHPLVDPALYRTETTREVVTFVNPTPFKGLQVALHLARRRPDIRFEFVESWPLRDDQRQSLMAELAALPNVTFTPRTDDMRSIYGRSRILLAPSHAESWGRVVTEAQASGIPVIASNVDGLPESVGDGGILVDLPDLPAWERALASLWDDQAKYQDYSRRAFAASRRPDIQPETLTARFTALLAAHAKGELHG
jgi:glycosyltransferase involved in cell wall biosynthesis